jgi:hypothetical protein
MSFNYSKTDPNRIFRLHYIHSIALLNTLMGLHQPVAKWLLLLVLSGIDRVEGLTPIDP